MRRMTSISMTFQLHRLQICMRIDARNALRRTNAQTTNFGYSRPVP
uniref:Uncharacterized protein n=1 Tax=Mesocestoides corti TaxID=53468 RepID=A0A5K3F614_MESCO